jgi:alanine racemase
MHAMCPSPHVTVQIDLNVVQQNARQIREQTGVPIIAVVKADAYGLGIDRVTNAIRDLVESWCVFDLLEAEEAELWKKTGKPSLVLGPSAQRDVADFLSQHARPAVWDAERAKSLRKSRPVLSVDTGMQRFACPREMIDAVIAAGECDEAFTHATDLDRVRELVAIAGGRGLKLHAAGSSLLDEPEARLNAVRPGLALYRGAVRVSSRLVEARGSQGPIGYSGFSLARHGVILCGYSNGLRAGPCLVNGNPSRILEVGMQSAYVELSSGDQAGNEVVLLGDSLIEAKVAAAWQTSQHKVLTRLCAIGRRTYRG